MTIDSSATQPPTHRMSGSCGSGYSGADRCLTFCVTGRRVKQAEALIKGLRRFKPTADHWGEDAVVALLRQLVELLRHELRTGKGQFDPALREPATTDSSSQGVTVPPSTGAPLS
jgi:hypothetical protein